MKKNHLYPILLILGFSILLLLPALFNGYPLVYSDSGTYIYSGFESKVPNDRPITYGLFIRHSSLSTSLWFTILAQALIVSYAIYLLLALFVDDEKLRNKVYGISAIILLFFSSLAWYTSFLMADIFTPISFILLLILLLKKYFKKMELLLLIIAYLFLSATHLSNSISTFLLVIALCFCRLIFQSFFADIPFKRVFYILLLSFCNFISVAGIHYSFGGGFVMSKSKDVFLVGKLVENGILKIYLDNECGKTNLKLCRYKDSLPDYASDFLWNDNSPLNKLGGWESNEADCARIKQDVFTNPHYLCLFIKEAIKSVLHQIKLNDFGEEYIPYRENSAPYYSVKNYYKTELNQYLNSKQSKKEFAANFFKKLSLVNNLMILFSIAYLFYLLILTKIEWKFKAAFIFSVMYYLCNLNTAVLSCFAARYCSRFTWIFILLAIIGFAVNQVTKKESLTNK